MDTQRSMAPPGTLGRWVAVGALEQLVVEDALYAGGRAERIGRRRRRSPVLGHDQQRTQCWPAAADRFSPVKAISHKEPSVNMPTEPPSTGQTVLLAREDATKLLLARDGLRGTPDEG
jgi:hypothetical protein